MGFFGVLGWGGIIILLNSQRAVSVHFRGVSEFWGFRAVWGYG